METRNQSKIFVIKKNLCSRMICDNNEPNSKSHKKFHPFQQPWNQKVCNNFIKWPFQQKSLREVSCLSHFSQNFTKNFFWQKNSPYLLSKTQRNPTFQKVCLKWCKSYWGFLDIFSSETFIVKIRKKNFISHDIKYKSGVLLLYFHTLGFKSNSKSIFI